MSPVVPVAAAARVILLQLAAEEVAIHISQRSIIRALRQILLSYNQHITYTLTTVAPRPAVPLAVVAAVGMAAAPVVQVAAFKAQAAVVITAMDKIHTHLDQKLIRPFQFILTGGQVAPVVQVVDRVRRVQRVQSVVPVHKVQLVRLVRPVARVHLEAKVRQVLPVRPVHRVHRVQLVHRDLLSRVTQTSFM
jgi:hypothetical protein